MDYTVPIPASKFTQKTRERLGDAIYLLGYLIARAKWQTGVVFATYQKISSESGFPVRTICRWLGRLIETGEITVDRVRGGIKVTVIDFESVARTHGVDYRRPVARKSCAADGVPPKPRRLQNAVDGAAQTPSVAAWNAAGGVSNKEKVHESKVENPVKALSSLILSRPKAPSGSGKTIPPVDDPGDELNKKADQGRRFLSELDEDRRRAVMSDALRLLAGDERPWIRAFAVKTDIGEVLVRGGPGREILLCRIAEMLEDGALRRDSPQEYTEADTEA